MITEIIKDLENIQNMNDITDEIYDSLKEVIEKLDNVNSIDSVVKRSIGTACENITLNFEDTNFMKGFDVKKDINLFIKGVNECGIEMYNTNENIQKADCKEFLEFNKECIIRIDDWQLKEKGYSMVDLFENKEQVKSNDIQDTDSFELSYYEIKEIADIVGVEVYE